MGIMAEPVQVRTASAAITAPGQLVINEDRSWHVGSIAEGKVDEILANVGDTVKQGQVLARMHSHDVHDVRAAHREAEAEVNRALNAEAYAKRVRDRVQRLFALKSASQQEVDSAEADLRTAASAVAKAEAELEKERVHLTEFLGVPIEDRGHAGGAPIHRHRDDDIPVSAPGSGIVLERKITLGTVVSRGDEVFIITDPSTLWMIAAVNEADLSRVQIGQTVRIAVRAYPARFFTGRVVLRGEALDPVTRTLPVRVLVPNPQGLLKPQMYATAEIAQPGTRQTLTIPQTAVQEVNGQQVVFVRTSPDQFALRPVEIARAIDRDLEVARGLEKGEQVVTKGSFVLKSQLLKSTLAEE